MDLLAILNTSESSDEGDRVGGGDLDLDQNSDCLDLEDILREHEDDDDLDGDDGDGDDFELSASSPLSAAGAAWRKESYHHSHHDTNINSSNSNSHIVAPRNHRGSSATTASSSSLNPDDWAVLQHILNESDDEEDYEDEDDGEYIGKNLEVHEENGGGLIGKGNNSVWSSPPKRYSLETNKHSRRHNMQVDALIERSSSDDDENYDENDNIMLTMMQDSSNSKDHLLSACNSLERDSHRGLSSINSAQEQKSKPMLHSQDGLGNKKTMLSDSQRNERQTLQFAPSDDKKPITEPISIFTTSPSNESAAIAVPAWQQSTNRQTQQQQQQPNRDHTAFDDEEIYRKALAHAHALERKLLKSGRREIVSPLMVKRRLKPKMELSARFATPRVSHQERRAELRRLSSTTGPRFSFSGIVENKAMTSVSAQLVKHADPAIARVLCGLPTCLAFNSKFIAVGTQLGIILIFDLFEVLRQRLGANSFDDSSTDSSAGSITSLDLSHNGEAVVAGYTSGILVLWDTIRGVVLRTVSDVHPSPITSVRFLTELKIVTVDAGGLVNKFTFSKNLLWSSYSVDTECLLDGTAGQILSMNVLPPYSSVKPLLRPELFSKALRNLTLIALSSERSSFAVAVDPKVNVLHRWARPSPDRMSPLAAVEGGVLSDLPDIYLPCLSWGWALISGGGNQVMPVLARAWGCCLQLLCASFPTLDDSPVRIGEEPVVHWPAFGVHNEFDAKSPIVALEWLNERSLMYLTSSREFTLVDTVMMTLLERLDFSGCNLVYAEFALSRAASKDSMNSENSAATCATFLNSTRCSDDRLMVLCQNEMRCISIVGAKRRISALESDGEWLEALAFALDHYENTVISQEDRKRDPNAKKDLSKHPGFASAKNDDEEWIAKLLIRYLNLAVENAPESEINDGTYSSNGGNARINLALSHFQMLAGVCIEFCVVTRRLDLLFGPIFRRFQNVGYVSVFLDVLEPYVLNDKLAYIGTCEARARR